eukprot:TRINITY_DN44664_c0_g1_i1.p1 TRINITY_DN44664_c0_g1~~TRINITY_DN44664_c0_g1_i1.p1  ORF type:complete len:429 (-),score=99.01 TRINITY_DN44664_c0_g1_i1:84-1370(-)
MLRSLVGSEMCIRDSKPCCLVPDCQLSDQSCQPQIQSFTTSTTITVTEALTLEMPSEITLPPNTKYPIQTNAHESQLSYKVVGTDGVVTVDSAGIISTDDTLGSCHLLILSASGDQSVVVTIHVRHMHQLMLVPPPLTSSIKTLEPSSKSMLLPVGSAVEIEVVVADEVGTRFTSIGDHALHFLRDRTDVLKVERVKGSPLRLRLMAKTHGIVATRVWVRSRSAAAPVLDDYIRISVGNIISPDSATVCIGGSVAFGLTSSYQSNVSTGSATWTAVNTEVATVDASTGKAVARSPGSTLVHVHTDTLRSHSLISVVRLGTAAITPAPRQPAISDQDTEYIFLFLVNVWDPTGDPLSPSAATGNVQHKLQLKCSASGEGESWVQMSASTDEKTGQLWCRLRVNPIAAHAASRLGLVLTATVTDLSLIHI